MDRRTALGLIGAGGALWGLGGSAARGRGVQDVEGSKGPRFVELKGHRMPVLAAGFGREGAIIATGSLDTTLTIWDSATGLDHPIFFHDCPVYAVAAIQYHSDPPDRGVGGDRTEARRPRARR